MMALKDALAEIANGRLQFYVYLLHDPKTGVAFYVGKGDKDSRCHVPRIAAHEQDASGQEKYRNRNRAKNNKIRKIWRLGGCVLYSLDSWHAASASAIEREIALIAELGRKWDGTGPLTNITAGGEGGMTDASQECRDRVSTALKQYYKDNPLARAIMSTRGQKRFASEEARREESERQKALGTHRHLRQWEKEHPELVAKRGREHSERMKQLHKERPEAWAGRKRSAEAKINMSKARRLVLAERPESDVRAKAKVKAITDAKVRAKQYYLCLVRQYLISCKILNAKLARATGAVNSKQLYRWRIRGHLAAANIDVPNGIGTVAIWLDLADKLAARMAQMPLATLVSNSQPKGLFD